VHDVAVVGRGETLVAGDDDRGPAHVMADPAISEVGVRSVDLCVPPLVVNDQTFSHPNVEFAMVRHLG